MSDERSWWRRLDWPSVLAYAGAAIAFLIGLEQYREDQRWRRLEFITDHLTEYENEPGSRLARLMLEYPEPTVCLFGGEPTDPDARCTLVTDSLLVSSLRGSVEAPARLTVEEERIVEAIDQFLNTLERLDFLLEQGFLAEEIRHPTVSYWMSLVGDRRWLARPEPVEAALCDYIAHYEYAGTRDLILTHVDPLQLTCSGPYFVAPDTPH